MIKPGMGRIESVSGVRFVLVQIHHPGTVERHNSPAEVEVLNWAGRTEKDSSKDPAIEVQTSTQVRYGHAEMIELDGRGLTHRLSIAGSTKKVTPCGTTRSRPRVWQGGANGRGGRMNKAETIQQWFEIGERKDWDAIAPCVGDEYI